MPNCALDMRTFLCLYVPGFKKQVFKHFNFVTEQSKEMKEKKNKGSVLVADKAFFSQKVHFGLVMKKRINKNYFSC